MKNQPANIDQRLMVLEEKLEYQDYTIEKLNEVIIDQQSQIDMLADKLGRLREEVQAGPGDGDIESEEPLPPHY